MIHAPAATSYVDLNLLTKIELLILKRLAGGTQPQLGRLGHHAAGLPDRRAPVGRGDARTCRVGIEAVAIGGRGQVADPPDPGAQQVHEPQGSA